MIMKEKLGKLSVHTASGQPSSRGEGAEDPEPAEDPQASLPADNSHTCWTECGNPLPGGVGLTKVPAWQPSVPRPSHTGTPHVTPFHGFANCFHCRDTGKGP